MSNIENIEITYKTILYVLGSICTIGGATAVLSRWSKPFKDLIKKVEDKANKVELEELKSRLDKLERYQDIDHDRIKEIERGNEKICKCILAITDHELTGNSIEKLRKAKEEMQDYLITK